MTLTVEEIRTTYTPDESGMTAREKAINALHYHIGREDLEYVDNMRVARKNHREFQQYLDQQRKGCCGSFDIEVWIDGEKWAIGCNYGH